MNKIFLKRLPGFLCKFGVTNKHAILMEYDTKSLL